eukprot:TRINITY_DN75590_c0_g1_i1.p1 TRINITY_DN75590_c0_g1~~TRINITY_DN75590_c0_g1_i1.p1  ORF type:complete len:100 (+),score=13.98 TRINITY_DN75590_c0_g1_i1:55-354(+)
MKTLDENNQSFNKIRPNSSPKRNEQFATLIGHKRSKSPSSYLDEFYVYMRLTSEIPEDFIDRHEMDDHCNYEEAFSSLESNERLKAMNEKINSIEKNKV